MKVSRMACAGSALPVGIVFGGLLATLIAVAPSANADPDAPPPGPAPAPVSAPGPAPGPPDANTIQVASADPDAPPPNGMPHLSSPENLPPGTTDTPADPSQGHGMSYLRELWHAVQTQDVSGGDALLLLTQRPLDANAAPPPGMSDGPTQNPIPAPAPADAPPPAPAPTP